MSTKVYQQKCLHLLFILNKNLKNDVKFYIQIDKKRLYYILEK